MHHLLGQGCLVSSLSAITIHPGEIAQPIHADDQVIPIPKPHTAVTANSMWAITDFTEANGATRIIPGSHLADHSPVYGQHYDSVCAEMPRGSILVWDGGLWHGGGANVTDQRRRGIAMNYCAGFIRQQENQQLGIPLDTLRSVLPRTAGAVRLRRLQGAHRPHRPPVAGAAPARPGQPEHHALGPHLTTVAGLTRWAVVGFGRYRRARHVQVPALPEVDRLPPAVPARHRRHGTAGFWQLGRYQDRQDFKAEVQQRTDADIVPVRVLVDQAPGRRRVAHGRGHRHLRRRQGLRGRQRQPGRRVGPRTR